MGNAAPVPKAVDFKQKVSEVYEKMNPERSIKRFHFEVIPPKQDAENLEERLEKFADRYSMVVEEDYCLRITDNAMGHLSFRGTELIKELELSLKPEKRHDTLEYIPYERRP